MSLFVYSVTSRQNLHLHVSGESDLAGSDHFVCYDVSVDKLRIYKVSWMLDIDYVKRLESLRDADRIVFL